MLKFHKLPLGVFYVSKELFAWVLHYLLWIGVDDRPLSGQLVFMLLWRAGIAVFGFFCFVQKKMTYLDSSGNILYQQNEG